MEAAQPTAQSAPVAPISDSAPSSISAQESAQKTVEKYKLKVDGNDVEVDLEELKRGYGHNTAANKRFQQATELDKAARGYVQSIKEKIASGDLKHLRELGVTDADLRKAAEALLLEQLEYDALPQAEKDLRAERKEKEELRRKLEEKEKGEKEAQERADYEKAHKEIDNEISEALKTLGRKPTPRLVRRIAEQMAANLSAKEEPLPAKLAAERAWKGLAVDYKEWAAEAKVEEILESLGSRAEDVRKHFISQVETQAPFARTAEKKDAVIKPIRTKDKRMSTDSWFEKMDKKLGVK